MLDKEKRAAVLALSKQGYGPRRLAKELRMGRNTVKRILKGGQAQPGGPDPLHQKVVDALGMKGVKVYKDVAHADVAAALAKVRGENPGASDWELLNAAIMDIEGSEPDTGGGDDAVAAVDAEAEGNRDGGAGGPGAGGQ